METTLLIIKPDALARGLVGRIISRLEQKGLKLVACKMAQLERRVLDEHYAHLAGKPFYERIASFMSSLPVILQCWEGVDAVAVVRRIAGVTNGREAEPGTIRGDLSMSIQCNLIHASDSLEAAKAEITRFFEPAEVFSYQAPLENLTYTYEELR